VTTLRDLLNTRAVLLGDGAMGTMLFAAGLESGRSPELWNVDHPEAVKSIYRAYAEAGSNLILTNSFGGTRFRLAQHQLQSRVKELNRAAAQLAREAIAEITSHPVLVGGCIGPSGERLDPLGTLTPKAAAEGFAEQAKALHDGGVDYFQVETMSDLREVEASIRGIRTVSDLPIITTMSFATNRCTMTGTTPQDAVHRMFELGADAMGANCGSSIEDNLWAIEQMRRTLPEAILVIKSSAGLPRYRPDGAWIYDGTPSIMAEYARHANALGVRIIGACCGSTPDHVRAMWRTLRAQ